MFELPFLLQMTLLQHFIAFRVMINLFHPPSLMVHAQHQPRSPTFVLFFSHRLDSLYLCREQSKKCFPAYLSCPVEAV